MGKQFTPCAWTGVTCSPSKDHVIKINISASSIKGFLAPELCQITYLQELILHGKLLLGTIPKKIGKLKNLKVLDLGNNHIMGPIPAEIGSFSSIMIINLQSNGLTVKLPPELGNLKYLKELLIDRNRLQGNLLAAAYPSKVESFQGNCLQNKDLKHRTSSQCANAQLVTIHESPPKHQSAEIVAKDHRASRPKWLLVLKIVTGSMVCLLFLVALFSAVHRWNNRPSLIIPWKKSSSEKEKFTVYVDSEMLKDVSRFTRQELEVACEDLATSLVADLTMRTLESYWDTVHRPHRLQECLFLNGEAALVSWARRMKIFIGIARGLKYLHMELDPPFTISELSSNVIYLTEDFYSQGKSKLVDFECWKTILARSEKNLRNINSEGAVCVGPKRSGEPIPRCIW
ncbi:hypothetical protein HA466_0069180 [Hirschfeldia incana]|nr:hypothetical protein HA466_0069180 [Hirschfeldia incana]